MQQPGQAMQQQYTLQELQQVIGQTVVSETGEELGQVQDIILQPQQLVVSADGRQVAVEFAQAQLQPEQQQVTLTGVTQEQLQTMQEFQQPTGPQISLREQGAAIGAAPGAEQPGMQPQPGQPTE